MSALRGLVDCAIERINARGQHGKLKKPDKAVVHDFQDQLSTILLAIVNSSIVGDRVDSIAFEERNGEQWLVIASSWWARGSMRSTSYYVPAHIIDSADPIDAARSWRREEQIRSAQHRATKATGTAAS